MTVHTIEIKPPSWEWIMDMNLELLRVNGFQGEAPRKAKEYIKGVGTFIDIALEENLLHVDDLEYIIEKMEARGITTMQITRKKERKEA